MAFDYAERVLKSPANAAIVGYASSGQTGSRWETHPSCHPSAVDNPYFTLGTHPDCVERLWNTLADRLEEDSRWVIWGRPVLAHPVSGAIFGYGTGTVYALRLDPNDFAEALTCGYRPQHVFGNKSMLDVSLFGDTWVFGKWKDEEKTWIQRAFLFAAS